MHPYTSIIALPNGLPLSNDSKVARVFISRSNKSANLIALTNRDRLFQPFKLHKQIIQLTSTKVFLFQTHSFYDIQILWQRLSWPQQQQRLHQPINEMEYDRI